MRLPLYCYKCDKLTGFDTSSFMKAKCRVCGGERILPVHRWVALIIVMIAFFGISLWFVYSLATSLF